MNKPTNRQRATANRKRKDDPFSDYDDEDDIIERDITTDRVLPPAQFRSEVFAKSNLDAVSEYADYRVMGWNPERAFTRVFGTDYADLYLYARIEALEHNMVYRKVFAAKFGAMELDKMWDAKTSAWELMSVVNNPFTKCSTRLAAIKELNVLFGIVMVDKDGNTRPGSDWTAFYRKANAEGQVEASRHPNPGTPEAEAYIQALRSDSKPH